MIKFRYVYSNGKEIKSFIYTIEEIEIGNFIGIKTSLEKQGFKLISRDRFTDITVNSQELFEKDIVKIEIDFGYGNQTLYGRVCFDKGGFVYRHETQGDKSLYGIGTSVGAEIISNTHIDELKEENDR